MKSLICLALVGAVMTATVEAVQGNGRGRSNPDVKRIEDRTVSVPVQVSIVFSPHDIPLIRTHYGNRYSNLPPGLKKKLARGGTLPPGWQKKMEPFPVALERELVVLQGGHRYGIYDGHAVIYHPITHAILDIISLF